MGLLLAVLVMPSALAVHTTDPTPSLEFAPVPPSPEAPPEATVSELPPAGSATGPAGASEASDADAPPPAVPPPTIPGGMGADPSQYRCVEGRQTEDPMAPPCVAFFSGDNFGATYAGVTEDSIDLLVLVDGNVIDNNTSRGREVRPHRTYFDLAGSAPRSNDPVHVRLLRGWQTYFNARYQTYGRQVRFHVYFADDRATAETRRADAADNYARVSPLAMVVGDVTRGGLDSYVESLAAKGVVTFGNYPGQDEAFFRAYPKLVWGLFPSLQVHAAQFAEVLCQRYVPHPVDHSDQYAGQHRVFGLVHTTDPDFPELRALKDDVVRRFESCGGRIAETAAFPRSGVAIDASHGPTYAIDAMSRFRAAGVTTVLWPGGYESKFSHAAAQLEYRPEFVLAGDGDLDGEFANRTAQEPTVWANALVVSHRPGAPLEAHERMCFQAYRSVDTETASRDIAAWGCPMYDSLRQVFTAIQVAGPRLGPTSMDEGLHAIPAVPTSGLEVPACFYLAGDYTCIKDVVLGRWDPVARQGSNRPACWRVIEGRRFLLGEVPGGNATSGATPDDPCLGYDSGLTYDPSPPSPSDL